MIPDELTLARLWQAQTVADDLRTSDEVPVRVVYRGVWTHRRGPDFTGVLLDLAGHLVSGDVELHRRTSDWYAHRHDEDPAYDRVVLHVVWHDDLGQAVRRRDGVRIPTLELSRFAVMTAEDAAARTVRPLGALGFGYCAPELAVRKPEVLHRLFEALGDRRLSEKTARIQARLSGEPAGQVLYWFLADALGYHQNREPMRAVAEALPLAVLEAALHAVRPEQRFAHAAGLLLGTAGFLPVSDRERGLVALSPAIWRAIEEAQGSRRFETGTSGTRWRIAAVRPANHPLRRLLSLAWLVADGQRGLLGEVRARFETVEPRRSLVDWLTGGPVPLGRDRAYEVLVNVVVPFAIALAEWTDEEPWREAAWRVWQRLPAGRGNRIVRSTLEQVCGPAGFRLRSARAEQGVLHLYRWGCLPRRCGECPVARLVHSGGAESG